ncbi:MAG: YbbR-like domain-containing protein [Dehalococcoidia bacterium]
MRSLREFIAALFARLRSLLWPIGGSLRGNASLAALSLVLAFSLWIFVTDTEDPTRAGVLPMDIPVEPVNVPPDMVVAGDIPEVRVRVEVAEDVFDTLRVEDFQATADLLGLQEGTHEVSVEVEALTGRGGLRVTQVIPDTVPLVLKPLFSRSVPVVVEISGSPASGHEMDEPELQPENIIVSGPEELVALVRDAVAEVDVTGLTSNLDRSFRLRASDGRGQAVEGVVLEPSVVGVRVPIRQVQVSRLLLVSPVLEGLPAEGYNLVGVAVEPPLVTAFGSVQALSNLSSVRTAEIDIDGATADVVRTVALDLPSDVTVAGGGDVQVTARIAPALGQVTFQVTPTIDNLDAGLRIANAPLPALALTLSGELPTLQSLQSDDIGAVLDLGGLDAGTHTVEPKLELPPGVTVVSQSPTDVTVELEERQ